jgi:hypothetical protein
MFGEAGGQSVDSIRCNKTTLIMRLKNWAAFFNEAYFAYWTRSGRDDVCPPVGSGPSNQYIGTEERQHARVLQDLTAQVDGDAIASRSDVPGVRVYVLRSSRMLAAYLHHFSDHTAAVSPRITLSVPTAGIATWIDPATGRLLRTDSVAAGSQTLTTPRFAIDLALLIKQRACLSSPQTGGCGRVKPWVR